MPCLNYLWSLLTNENLTIAAIVGCTIIIVEYVRCLPEFRVRRAVKQVHKAYTRLHRNRQHPSDRVHSVLNLLEDNIAEVRLLGERFEKLEEEREAAEHAEAAAE